MLKVTRMGAEGLVVHDVNQFVFNDGSVQVEVVGDMPIDTDIVSIEAGLKTPADQMGLIMLVGAIRVSCPATIIHLLLPFTPYGRQDAPFCKGQANAMKEWAGVLNSLNFATVVTLDPHSIAVSHIDNCVPVDIVDVIKGCPSFLELLSSPGLTLVSPDAGANKKAHKIVQAFGFAKLVRADKARDLATGQILETEVYGDVEGDTCIIIDDLCDGGMTFIKLAEALRAKGADKVILFVTHGLFTKGLEVFEGLIDEVYTTTSWHQSTDISGGYSGKYTVFDGTREG